MNHEQTLRAALEKILNKAETTYDMLKIARAALAATAAPAEQSAVLKNAERFEWLRFADDDQIKALAGYDGLIPEGEKFDAAIDAAIAEQDKLI